MRTMADAVNVGAMPRGLPLYAGYVSGQWATYAHLRALYPGATYVSIATKATVAAQVLDVENGDATPEQAPLWVYHARLNGQATPTVYCNTSTWPTVSRAFQVTGIAEPLWWLARYEDPPLPELIPGSIATQYATGRYDRSIVADFWPGVDDGSHPAPAPAPLPPPTTYPGGKMRIPLTVSIVNGVGWEPLPAGVNFEDVEGVAVYSQTPGTVGSYVKVPAWVGKSSDPPALEFGPGAYGPAPDGTYGFDLFTAP